jgi:hypothetical protein
VKLPVVVSRPDKSVLCLSYLWSLELSGGLYICFQDKANTGKFSCCVSLLHFLESVDCVKLACP